MQTDPPLLASQALLHLPPLSRVRRLIWSRTVCGAGGVLGLWVRLSELLGGEEATMSDKLPDWEREMTTCLHCEECGGVSHKNTIAGLRRMFAAGMRYGLRRVNPGAYCTPNWDDIDGEADKIERGEV